VNVGDFAPIHLFPVDRVGGRTMLREMKCADSNGDETTYSWEFGGMWVGRSVSVSPFPIYTHSTAGKSVAKSVYSFWTNNKGKTQNAGKVVPAALVKVSWPGASC